MKRRALLTSIASLAVVPLSGCLSLGDAGEETGELQLVEVANENEAEQTFHVTLFDATGDQTFQRTATLSGATGNRFTREVCSEAPESAAKVRVTVGDETSERELGGFKDPITLSIKYHRSEKIGIWAFT